MHTRHPATGWSNFPPPPWSNFGPPLTHAHLRGRGGQRDRGRLRQAQITRIRLERLRQPEVQHLHHAVIFDLDVCRLEIAVDDPLLMRSFKAFRDLLGNGQRFINRDRSLLDSLGQSWAFDEFEN